MTVTVEEKQVFFVAVEGSRLTDQQAAEYGPELYRLYRNGIALTAGNVVAEARKRGSALRSYFTWDDRAAAEKWREREARNLLASIAFAVQTGLEDDPEPLRFFACLSVTADDEEDPEKQYIPMHIVHADPDMEGELLRIAARELKAFQRKYQRLRRLDAVVNWAALDALLNEVMT